MTRVFSAILASTLLIAGPALADEAAKVKSDTVKADGTKVSVKKKKDIKSDGTGEVKTEVKTEDPNTGTETTKRTKTTKDKNDDGTVKTTNKTETETKTK